MSRAKWKHHLFVVAQVAAGMGFIFSSVWLRHDFQHAPGFVKDAIVTLNRPAADDLGVISSRVLKVAGPVEFSPLKFNVETRQFRFELEDLNNEKVVIPKQRKIASIKNHWALRSIRRRVGESQWEEVDLIRDEQNAVAGSVFLELDEGANTFSLVYQNSNGDQRERPVNITHSAP